MHLCQQQQSSALSMAFRFLGLPLELRTKVYRYLLCHAGSVAVHSIGALCPEKTRESDRTLIFADSVPLLRACSQTHSEGTVILYGTNQFHFKDTYHDCAVDYYAPCSCLKMSQITFLHSWLHSIGSNRMKVKKFFIKIQNPCLLLFPEEMKDNLKAWPDLDSYSGSHLGKAFELLSLNNNLQTLELDFSEAEGNVPRLLFDRGMKSVLVQKLSKITGLQELKVTPLPDTAAGLETLAKLKSIMEKGGPAEQNSQLETPPSTTMGPVSTKALAERIAILAEEREKLQDNVAGQNKRIKELNAIIVDMGSRIQ